ncbi:MAG: peptidoglycan DD-metalloendopeptidase family protein [Bacteroidales bacterium]|nr:peptidoglycan DD-metalloendopeptidase family protein [Bacteroidales bacterium]
MRKLLLIISFLFFFICLYSQKANLNADTTVSVYDLLFVKAVIDSDEQILQKLNSNISFYQDKVVSTKNTISKQQDVLDYYSVVYSRMLRNLYLLSLQLNSTIFFVFSSESFNQAFNRYNYISLIIKYIKNVKEYLSLLHLELENQLLVYQNYSKSLNFYLKNFYEKKQEIDNNVKLALTSASILQQKADYIRILINQNYRDYSLLTAYFTKIAVKDSSSSDNSFYSSTLPLENPIIISSFGSHDHPYLKNIKILNDGIDLYSKNDTLVKCIYVGKVVSIVNLPNFGSSVIVKHGDYYSVYSNLNIIYVSIGQNISENQLIGTLSVSTSKYSFGCLNLQIWHNTQKLNPVKFLNI